MSAPINGGPAFPKTGAFHQDANSQFDSENQDGMTLRDYFAAKAMPAVYSEYCSSAEKVGFDEGWMMGVAMDAYAMSDAMLAAREAVNPVEQPTREVLSDDLSKCQRALIDAGKPYPKTCPVCGLGGKCKREGGAV